MIVQCPECQTKYNLPDSKILDSGTKVRCSRCTHTFTAYPEGVEPTFEPAPKLQTEVKAAPVSESAASKPEPVAPNAQPQKEVAHTAEAFGGTSGKAGSEADFDEEDFLASLGDLSDLGKDPFEDKRKDSDEISFSDDFLKDDVPAKADRKKKPAVEDEDIFGGLSSETDLDALLGDKPAARKKPADDLGLDDLDLGSDFASSPGRESKKASGMASGEQDDLGLGEDLGWGESTENVEEEAGGRQDKPGAAAQEELGDDEFEAALRGLSMDLDEGDSAPAGRSAGRQRSLDQSDDMDDLWPTANDETGFEDETGSGASASGLGLNLDGVDDFDRQPKKQKKKSGGAGKLLLFLLLFVFLLAGGGVAAIHYLGLWSSLPPWVQDLARTAGLPQSGSMAKPAEEQVRLLSLENIRQYTVQNEKAGQVFVIEGKVVNNFPSPKEFIRVQASLYDQTGNVVVSKDMSAGNTVSLFQLQIMSPQEIDAALNSDVGILSNNSDVQTGESVPFMAVFFNAPETVAEFGVKVIEARDPAK
ncbi:putative paraquat-inducible protein A [Desulfocurvibacter africanus PCS]|uniref:Putative paraquat-inducible protein A n=1 Tax=Desulfocurvibacter africanus PCS TaxID=1262666 RepID=M5PQZ0_DESAF|nr:DUF3426 domain-containing protein [Desulfocurvibacter africanus]EMG36792.1 putative paraquat-inducible protein A [Desulfocurvibacter africanus PCS]